jgi:hypothetical protein
MQFRLKTVPGKTVAIASLALGFVLVAGTAFAALTFNSTAITSDGALTLNPTGQPVTVNGNLTVTGSCTGCGGGGLSFGDLATPPANTNLGSSGNPFQRLTTAPALADITPAVVPTPAGGTTSYDYYVIAVFSDGSTTGSSISTSISNGPASLDGTHFNAISWTAVPGATNYRIYVDDREGTPSSLGLLGTTSSTTFNDTGQVASNLASPYNTTNRISGNAVTTKFLQSNYGVIGDFTAPSWGSASFNGRLIEKYAALNVIPDPNGNYSTIATYMDAGNSGNLRLGSANGRFQTTLAASRGGDYLGAVQFVGMGATTFVEGAEIDAQADGSNGNLFTDTSAPTSLVFFTNPTGAIGASQEVLRLKSDKTSVFQGSVTATDVVTTPVTVSGLPTCNAGAKGAHAFVTDANATTFHSTAGGGGSNNIAVACDGTSWKIGG